ncbi:MAG TPA: tRNA lysidine(34) synthetase TilS [Burkholderiales bacterium]|nr:tRNA lysidine(34) synthetase TilS [Burkholderiales bacterium]
MGSSRRSRPSEAGARDLAAHVAGELTRCTAAGARIALGLSGGIDSVVLLDVLAAVQPRRGYALSAVHVNHGLSPNAEFWQRFCERLCRRRGIALRTERVQVARGDSTESAARAARYRVFERLDADAVVLAHNQDDQAETLLLQLLRGAGVKGLSAMPVVRPAAGRSRLERLSAIPPPAIVRPLLDVPRAEIEAYARARRLKWIEDESNDDVAYDRNYLRHRVLPALEQRFPGYRTTLARAARHFAEAEQLLDALAAIDARGAVAGGGLRVDRLQRVGATRAKNLLRRFLDAAGVPMLPAARLEECVRQVLAAGTDSAVRIDAGAAALRLFDGVLSVVDGAAGPQPDYRVAWHGEPALELDALGGTLYMCLARGDGISAAKLAQGPVTVRVRRGGERIRPHRNRPRRTLKNLLQEKRLAPWRRERLPLLYVGDTLVWAAGIGVDCAYRAGAGEASVRPEWRQRASGA